MRTLLLTLSVCTATVWLWSQQIPAGTILPVMLDDTIDSNKTKVGEEITAKLKQQVPLPDDAKIKRDSRVIGHVVAVSRASVGHMASITVQFNRIEIDKQSVPISVGLRSLASMQLVAQSRQSDNANSGFGTSVWDLNMSQIGGQIAYNGQKIVKAPNGQVVGRVPEPGAVLGIPMANSARGCTSNAANTAEQAFWAFSTDACGIYGMKDMTYVSGIGGKNPGQIILKSPKSVEIRGGSGWLLQVN